MRAYLIASDVGPDDMTADAVVRDARAASASLQATGDTVMAGRRRERLMIRVDGIETPGLEACLAAAAALEADAIVLPARHGRDVAHLGSRLAVLEAEHGLPDGGIGIVAIVACAAGVLSADSFAGASLRLRGLGWDGWALARQLGMPEGSLGIVSHPRPHPEVPQGSEGPEGGLQPNARSLKPAFGARLRPTHRDEGASGSDPWGSRPVLAHARAVVRLAAAAAGVEAIETAYAGDDAEGFGALVAAARRDGFGAMFVRNPAQVQLMRAKAQLSESSQASGVCISVATNA